MIVKFLKRWGYVPFVIWDYHKIANAPDRCKNPFIFVSSAVRTIEKWYCRDKEYAQLMAQNFWNRFDRISDGEFSKLLNFDDPEVWVKLHEYNSNVSSTGMNQDEYKQFCSDLEWLYRLKEETAA